MGNPSRTNKIVWELEICSAAEHALVNRGSEYIVFFSFFFYCFFSFPQLIHWMCQLRYVPCYSTIIRLYLTYVPHQSSGLLWVLYYKYSWFTQCVNWEFWTVITSTHFLPSSHNCTILAVSWEVSWNKDSSIDVLNWSFRPSCCHLCFISSCILTIHKITATQNATNKNLCSIYNYEVCGSLQEILTWRMCARWARTTNRCPVAKSKPTKYGWVVQVCPD